MLYEKDGKVLLMKGAEKLPFAKPIWLAKREFPLIQEYTYRMYSRFSLAYSLPPIERHSVVCEMLEVEIDFIESSPLKDHLKNFIKGFQNLILTDDERTLQALRRRVEIYTKKISGSDDELEEDGKMLNVKDFNEYMKGISSAQEEIVRVEQRIASIQENSDYSGEYGEYLFEIPDDNNPYVNRFVQ
jgi:hypothetical protein